MLTALPFRTFRFSRPLLSGLALLATAAACRPTTPGGGRTLPPPRVTTVTVLPETIAESPELVGEVVAYRRIEVRTPIKGIIEERAFREGSTVRTGDVLYRIERTTYDAAFRSAEARLRNAERTLARLRPLLADNAVAKQDVDNAETELLRAQAAYDQAKKDLDDTIVRAEITGQAGKALMEKGGRVSGSDNLLTTIDQLDPVYVSFRPSVQQILAWRALPNGTALLRPGGGLRLTITLASGDTIPEEGTLDFVDPVLDQATGTQEFRGRFANARHLLTPGQFVRVHLHGFRRENALVIPQRAVQQALGRQFVYVVAGGDTVQARDVATSSWTGDRWIITRGLEPGDRVLVDGAQKVGPGMVVTAVPLATDSTAAGASHD